jgi:hypothetical protein
MNYSDPSGLSKEKPINIRYTTFRDHFNVILARTFNANFRVAFRDWKNHGIVDNNAKAQKELIFSRSKNYKNKLTDIHTDEKAAGTITHINYNKIFSKSTRYKIIKTTYFEYYTYNTSSDGSNSGLTKKATGTAILHNKIKGDAGNYNANNLVGGMGDNKTESYTVDGVANEKIFKIGEFSDNQKVEVSGTYFDRSQENRESMGWDGLGNSGNDFEYGFTIFVKSYSDPIILKVPTNILGGLKWRKATDYTPDLLETIYKSKLRGAQN